MVKHFSEWPTMTHTSSYSFWKSSQPLFWGSSVSGTEIISVPQNTRPNLPSDYIFIRNVYKNVVDLFNFTEPVQALKMKHILLRKVSQSNHSLGTAVTPEWAWGFSQLCLMLEVLAEQHSLPPVHSALILFCNGCTKYVCLWKLLVFQVSVWGFDTGTQPARNHWIEFCLSSKFLVSD